MVTHFDLAATCRPARCSTVNGYTSLNRVRISSAVFLWQSPSDVKQEKQMSSILDDQLRLIALKQYGLIKSIKTPDISEADLTLVRLLRVTSHKYLPLRQLLRHKKHKTMATTKKKRNTKRTKRLLINRRKKIKIKMVIHLKLSFNSYCYKQKTMSKCLLP